MNRKRLTQAERREETRFRRGAVYYNFADKEELFLELLDRRCAERARDLCEVFADTDEDDVEATSRQAQVAADNAVEAMTGDSEWRALYLEFLAHAARDRAFRRRFSKRTGEMRGALEEVVIDRTRPVADALGMEPAQLAVVVDALADGLWAQHMLHGSRAVPPDLFSKVLALIVDGIAARAGITAQPTRAAAT